MKTPLLGSACLAWWAPTVGLDAWGSSALLPRTVSGGARQPAQAAGAPPPQLGHRSPPPQMLLSTPGCSEDGPAAQCSGVAGALLAGERVLVVSGKHCRDLQHF